MEQVWLNFPVADVERTANFYKGIGFTINGIRNEKLVSVRAGKNNLIVNFFITKQFENSIQGIATDTTKTNEILITIGVGSTEEVAALAEKAEACGGHVFSKPQDFVIDGVTYHGCGFSDPDGHKWNALRMEAGM